MKVAYVIDGMYNSGGMERVLSVCANALSEYYDVAIVTAFQQGRPDYFYLVPKVRRHDLDLLERTPLQQKRNEFKRRFSLFLEKEHFDVVVSLGGMDLDFLHSIQDGSKKIVWFHFAIDIAETTWVGPDPSFLAKVKAKLRTWKRIYHAKKYDKIVVISKADLENWARFTNRAVMIYNPLTITNPVISELTEKKVISVGRLDFQKGFDYLIDAWNVVYQKHPDWHLNIYGEGGMRNDLQNQINDLHLENSITLCGRTPEIEKEYAWHSIYVMSSRAEGFGLVLVEAASCGLPLVAFDCPSGPSELVINGKNGFLIDRVGDVDMMAKGICKLIEDGGLRKKMGIATREFSQQFKIDNIVPKWVELFYSVTE